MKWERGDNELQVTRRFFCLILNWGHRQLHWAYYRGPITACGVKDSGYYHGLGQSMPCMRKPGHRGKHVNQWKERW